MTDAPEQTELLIRPSHVTFATLLTAGTIQAPRYQRNYAWRDQEIATFLRDLEACRVARGAGLPKHHFFGGVVTAVSQVQGSERPNLEVIDGQQRLATVCLLINQLRSHMIALAGRLDPPGEALADFLTKTAGLLEDRYEVYEDTIEFRIVPVPRLTLSRPDREYFTALLAGAAPEPDRQSHLLLRGAFAKISEYLQDLLAVAASDEERAGTLDTLRMVLEKDWTIIHMKASHRRDAYMLFQTLNDRGRGLTEGELLRASTLEALEPIATAGEMTAVEAGWNAILNGRDIDVGRALGSSYASQMGQSPGAATLLTDLQSNLFPMLERQPINRDDAVRLIEMVGRVEKDVAVLTTIMRGEWPYLSDRATCAWERDRLRLLIVHLRQYDCLPLLISAPLLPPERYSALVQSLERFCFRYNIMADGPKLEAAEVLNRHAVEIRRDASAYRLADLQRELSDLIALHAPDDVFRARLNDFTYPRGSETRKPLKYFLMTLEHYVRWCDDGAAGRPQCRDTSRLLDFENTTIEHIYPENAEPVDEALEALIDVLGNLTILSPDENTRAGAKSFDLKRRYFEASHSTLNKQIGETTQWNPRAVEARQERLITLALQIFRM